MFGPLATQADDAVDVRFGFDKYSEGPMRTAFMINIQPVRGHRYLLLVTTLHALGQGFALNCTPAVRLTPIP